MCLFNKCILSAYPFLVLVLEGGDKIINMVSELMELKTGRNK